MSETGDEDFEAAGCAVCGVEFHLWAVARICSRCIKDLPSCETGLRLQPTDAMIEAIAAAQTERALNPSTSPDSVPDVISFPRTVVDGFATMAITMQLPHSYPYIFKPRVLRVTEGCQAFVIEGITVGRNAQLFGAKKFSRYRGDNLLRVMHIDAVGPAVNFTMVVSNQTNRPATFDALWEGDRTGL